MSLDISGKFFRYRAGGTTYSYYSYTSKQNGTYYLAFKRRSDGATRYIPFKASGNGKLRMRMNNTVYQDVKPSASIVVNGYCQYTNYTGTLYRGTVWTDNMTSNYGVNDKVKATVTIKGSGSGSDSASTSMTMPANSKNYEDTNSASNQNMKGSSFTVTVKIAYGDDLSQTKTATLSSSSRGSNYKDYTASFTIS